MKVLFVQTAHKATDDRIYHQQMSMKKCQYETQVLSVRDWVSKKRQYKTIQETIKAYNPDILLCDTPKAVIFSIGSKAKKIYDITEWYPSKKNLRDTAWWLLPIRVVALFILFLVACCMSDGFIIGEKYKAVLTRLLFPWKKQLILPYFPSKTLFEHVEVRHMHQPITLLYAGPLTAEKGWDRVQKVVAELGRRNPTTSFVMRLITYDDDIYYDGFPDNVSLETSGGLSLEDFCTLLDAVDICLDLRDVDVENTHCLPIKLFYYMAAGKPAIYSNLKAITKHFPEVSEFDFLIAPDDIDLAVNRVEEYLHEPELYMRHALAARHAFSKHFNWESLEPDLMAYLAKFK